VFERRGRGAALTVVQNMALDTELPPSRELGTDRPGRSFESVGSTRHAMESQSDPHREHKRQFAHRIADLLHERLHAKSFDRLVVAAPAVTMGDLRAALSDQVKAVIAAELVADLTKTPVAELPARLAKHVEI
jgi:protein required for attachment to host cells